MTTATVTFGTATNSFLRELTTQLRAQLIPEMELTLRVGVMSAGGLTRKEILEGLTQAGHDVDDLDVRIAIRRLQRVADNWR
jgi:hypothetical protein